jgi:hypothetical protein
MRDQCLVVFTVDCNPPLFLIVGHTSAVSAVLVTQAYSMKRVSGKFSES